MMTMGVFVGRVGGGVELVPIPPTKRPAYLINMFAAGYIYLPYSSRADRQRRVLPYPGGYRDGTLFVLVGSWGVCSE